MIKTILILGANGMFGQDAVTLFRQWGYKVIAAAKSDVDISNAQNVENFFAENSFDYVINAAAYTKVDDAELEKDLAFLINQIGAKNVAEAANKKSIPLVFISTDYVFDGEKSEQHFPQDKTNPINVYGASKLAGEKEVAMASSKYYIARTSWLYGKNGKNFVDTMINLGQKNSSIKVVSDQFGCPTYTYDLAFGIRRLLEESKPFGIYHICNSGVTTWFDFAKKIFEIANLRVEVVPVKTEEFPRPAKRPKFSAMNNDGILRNWELALKDYLKIN